MASNAPQHTSSSHVSSVASAKASVWDCDMFSKQVEIIRKKRRRKRRGMTRKRARAVHDAMLAENTLQMMTHSVILKSLSAAIISGVWKKKRGRKAREQLTPTPSHPIIPAQRYNFRDSPLDPRSLFRFTEEEIHQITSTMNVARWHKTYARDRFSFLEGFLIVCRRLVFPARWMDLIQLFGRSKGPLSRIFHYTLQLILSKYLHLLHFRVDRLRSQLPAWAAAVARACPNAYENVVLFLDGTLRKTCRPKPSQSKLPDGVTQAMLQRAQYDGRKNRHGFKYHAAVAPVGLIVHAHGPVDGRRHDVIVAKRSGLLDEMNNLHANGVNYAIYADSAYGLHTHMQTPYRKPKPGSTEARLNTCMARARTVASECTYGIITNQWQAVDFVRWQRMFQTQPAAQYMCAILLTNIELCIRRTNQVAHFFACNDQAPTLANYLAGTWYPTE